MQHHHGLPLFSKLQYFASRAGILAALGMGGCIVRALNIKLAPAFGVPALVESEFVPQFVFRYSGFQGLLHD